MSQPLSKRFCLQTLVQFAGQVKTCRTKCDVFRFFSVIIAASFLGLSFLWFHCRKCPCWTDFFVCNFVETLQVPGCLKKNVKTRFANMQGKVFSIWFFEQTSQHFFKMVLHGFCLEIAAREVARQVKKWDMFEFFGCCFFIPTLWARRTYKMKYFIL